MVKTDSPVQRTMHEYPHIYRQVHRTPIQYTLIPEHIKLSDEGGYFLPSEWNGPHQSLFAYRVLSRTSPEQSAHPIGWIFRSHNGLWYGRAKQPYSWPIHYGHRRKVDAIVDLLTDYRMGCHYSFNSETAGTN